MNDWEMRDYLLTAVGHLAETRRSVAGYSFDANDKIGSDRTQAENWIKENVTPPESVAA